MKTVAVIDDDPASRAALAEILRSRGWRVIELADGIECVSMLETLQPDAMVVDLAMPVFDGERLIDYVAAVAPALLERIVIVTGSNAVRRRDAWPVAAVLTKPVDVAALLRTAPLRE